MSLGLYTVPQEQLSEIESVSLAMDADAPMQFADTQLAFFCISCNLCILVLVQLQF